MNDGSGSTRISLRLADGEYFPLFSHGDPDTRNLSLVPASENQEEADIHFFYHFEDGSAPVNIGVVRFPDLPSGTGDTELHLDAVIESTGLLTVIIRHRESGRLERLEMTLPDEDDTIRPPRSSGGLLKSRPGRIILGILFVAAGLALVFWLTMRVTNWGRQDIPAPPLSLAAMESNEV